mgnify:FL=1
MNPIEKNITDALDLSALPVEEQQEILIRTGTVIYQNVLMRVMEILTEEEQNEFEKLLDNEAKPEKIFSFLKNKVKDLEKIIEEEASKFKNKANDIMSQIG